MSQGTAIFGLTTRSTGEIRGMVTTCGARAEHGEHDDCDGVLRFGLVEATEDIQTEGIEVGIDDLKQAVERRGLTDDELRELGFTEDIINTIRSES